MSLKDQLEAILFIASRPLTVGRLTKILGAEEVSVRESLTTLTKEYRERGGGVTIAEHEGEVQMVTTSAAASLVQKFLKDETTGELTKPSLETLTIVAYRGPVTRADIEKVRGVNCSIILRNLMVRGLIQASEDKKRLVMYYTVSMDFLRFLGLPSIQELPEYDMLHETEALERFLAQGGATAVEA